MRTMKGHDCWADMVTAHNLVRHNPAIHHVNCIGLELGDGPADLAPQPIVRRGSFCLTIDEQYTHVQADRAQALDLFSHKDTPAWERRRRVNICDGQDSHKRPGNFSSGGLQARDVAEWPLKSGC